MSISVNKKSIGIICNGKELFLSLKRALTLFFTNANFYFYCTNIIDKDQFNVVRVPKEKEAGCLIAFFTTEEENQKVCQFIKYLRIKGRLRFPLIFCSSSSGELLQNLFDILTYGENSHRYHPIPIDIHTFIRTIFSAAPMSSGNYTLFCTEYSEKHKEFYKKKILPLLGKADKKDVWTEWLNDLELLIEEFD